MSMPNRSRKRASPTVVLLLGLLSPGLAAAPAAPPAGSPAPDPGEAVDVAEPDDRDAELEAVVDRLGEDAVLGESANKDIGDPCTLLPELPPCVDVEIR